MCFLLIYLLLFVCADVRVTGRSWGGGCCSALWCGHQAIIFLFFWFTQLTCLITISNHNNQPNIREKDADLLWKRSSRQRDFNHPPFLLWLCGTCQLIVHVFLHSPMQTKSHRMFILLPLPRLLFIVQDACLHTYDTIWSSRIGHQMRYREPKKLVFRSVQFEDVIEI